MLNVSVNDVVVFMKNSQGNSDLVENPFCSYLYVIDFSLIPFLLAIFDCSLKISGVVNVCSSIFLVVVHDLNLTILSLFHDKIYLIISLIELMTNLAKDLDNINMIYFLPNFNLINAII